MDKKSAFVAAGGLAASFVAGVGAVSVGWGIGSPSAASTPSASSTAAAKVKPIVKHRTIVVHRKSPAPKPNSPAAPQTVVLAPVQASAPAPAVTHTSGSPTAGGDDGNEHEGGDD